MTLDLLEGAGIANRIVHADDPGLLGDVVIAIAGVWVIAEPLRSSAAALLLDGPEHVGHLARVVAGARHQLRALEVGLLLVFAAEAQKGGSQPELCPLRYHLAPAAADDGPENGTGHLTDFVLGRLAGLRGAVP